MPTHSASNNSGVHNNEQNTLTYNHAQGDLTNGIAMVRVTSQDSNPVTISGVTYGGVACTHILTTNAGSTSRAVSLWYRVLGTSASGSKAVVASFSEAQNSHIVSVSTYNDVDQTTPYVSRTNNPKSVDNFDTAAPSEARVTIDSAVGELVVAAAGFFSSTTNTPTTSQNNRAAVLSSGNHSHGGSDAAGASPTVNMSWSDAGSVGSGIVGVSLQSPVAAPEPFVKLEIRAAP